MREKKPEPGPKIKRDEHNVLDQDDAQRIVTDLTKTLITEERALQKEISFKNARTDRRDIVVKVIIYQKNTINNKIVATDIADPGFEKLSDDPLDPFRYKMFDYLDGEIAVHEMPLSASKVGRWSMGMMKALVNYLARMNVMDRV